jgi:hypothetical protein
MVQPIQNLKTSNLNPVLNSNKLLGSLKYVINLVMQIRYTRFHKLKHLL